ncbi:hypothetical protein N7495_005186 [Penicillium taxi]|uniref:uncharacterized protein n=1 Tax=Penicillium taxi TaxID=168475 RepID=UPI00254508A8|nr:uncharacterized protein N7495_005186 [Penicillium taxi]KAJ5893495.1 hypothetical protein N7495_005186 [Penicillium taxi]
MADESVPETTTGESLLTVPSSDAQSQLTVAVDELLANLEVKFDAINKEMIEKLEDMARRMDELEASFVSSGIATE